MTGYIPNNYNKSHIKEEGKADPKNNAKISRFMKASLTFNQYNHYKYNKWRFESQNLPLDVILDCINKVTKIVDKYVNDTCCFNLNLKNLIAQDLLEEKDESIKDKQKIGDELVLKFNIDRLCDNIVKYKLTQNKSNLNNLNDTNTSQSPVTDLDIDKNDFYKSENKKSKFEKPKQIKARVKGDFKKGKLSKNDESIANASILNYYIKYFNYLKLYYQYYLNHFISVYIFYKSPSSNLGRNRSTKPLFVVKDRENTLLILKRLFVYLRKLIVLHLKCLINLLPLSYVYNPDNFINYTNLIEYNEVINSKMNSLSISDSDLQLELKAELFDNEEFDTKFDLEEFNSFLSANNLNAALDSAPSAAIATDNTHLPPADSFNTLRSAITTNSNFSAHPPMNTVVSNDVNSNFNNLTGSFNNSGGGFTNTPASATKTANITPTANYGSNGYNYDNVSPAASTATTSYNHFNKPTTASAYAPSSSVTHNDAARTSSSSSSNYRSGFSSSAPEPKREPRGYNFFNKHASGTNKTQPMYNKQDQVPIKREQFVNYSNSKPITSFMSKSDKIPKKVKIDTTDPERLGKELKSGKKLNSSNRFNTMNIKQIFNRITSKSDSSGDSKASSAKHVGYKSAARLDEHAAPKPSVLSDTNSISSIESSDE